MMKRVWKFGLAAVASVMGAVLLACSDGGPGSSAGTTFETENDIALTILNENGTPAANALVLVRRVDYLAASTHRDYEESLEVQQGSPIGATDTAAGIFNVMTDDQGRVSIKAKMKRTSYMVEARGQSAKAVTRLSMTENDSIYPVEIKLGAPGRVSGQVYLPRGVRVATVGVQGIDYFVQTDSLGNFVFESLPAGTFNVVSFIYNEQKYEVDGEEQVFSSHQHLGFVSTKIQSGNETDDVKIGDFPQDTGSTETLLDYQFEDFEHGVLGWYTSVSDDAFASLNLTNAGNGREGGAAHLTYRDSAEYGWTLMGHAFSEKQDFSTMDSLVVWVRGATDADTQWVSFSFDVLVDSTSEYKSGKAWAHRGISANWERYVIVPSDFVDPEESPHGGNIGWEEVKTHVTNLNIFAGGSEGEIWVDDIEIYGVKDFERP